MVPAFFKRAGGRDFLVARFLSPFGFDGVGGVRVGEAEVGEARVAVSEV